MCPFSFSLKSFFLCLDYFGVTPHLFLNHKSKTKSFFGAFSTLILIAIGLYFLTTSLLDWRLYGKSTVTISALNYDDIEVMANKKSFVYNFTQKNYYPVIVVYSNINGTFRNLSELKEFINLKMTYTNSQNELVDLKTESCLYKKQDEFLGLSQEVLEQDGDTVSQYSLCLTESQEMGLFVSQSNINITSLNFQINVCKENCANETEIMKMLKYISFTIYLPHTTYDFTDKRKPGVTRYDKNVFFMDFYNTKYIYGYLFPSNLNIDDGWISDEYVLKQTNFNVEKQTSDVYRREQNEPIFSYYIRFGNKIENIYIRNQKIQEVLGSFGGFLSIIINLFKVVCLSYNSIKIKEKIIKSSFRNASPQENYKPCFSFINHFFFWRKKDPKRKIAIQNFYEYMDIQSIIKKLQEIEKLKNVIFDDEQKELFDMVPKPLLMNVDKSFKFGERKKLTIIDKYKKVSLIVDNLKNKTSCVNQRLMSLLEVRNFGILNSNFEISNFEKNLFEKELAEISNKINEKNELSDFISIEEEPSSQMNKLKMTNEIQKKFSSE